PTSLPFATLKGSQTRHLPTRLVRLTEPNPENPVVMPAKGERLRIGDIGQLSKDERLKKALTRLAADKAPQTVAQLVMWRVASGLEWDAISDLSKTWANAQELTLARQFVDNLDDLKAGESGRLLLEVKATDSALQTAVDEITKTLKDEI